MRDQNLLPQIVYDLRESVKLTLDLTVQVENSAPFDTLIFDPEYKVTAAGYTA
ncbi:hypothetical protein GCM10009720_04150 [Yaniella flava]|uniref:Uncharacterized protein n=1 Tax=Yaniella flava TaxID=287930 RepID=A0ABP5FM50_9MICC